MHSFKPLSVSAASTQNRRLAAEPHPSCMATARAVATAAPKAQRDAPVEQAMISIYWVGKFWGM